MPNNQEKTLYGTLSTKQRNLSGTMPGDTVFGIQGDPGRGIASIERISGSGAAGSVDTYRITYTDNTSSTFSVRNGTNGQDGRGIVSIERTSGTGAAGSTDIYTITYTDNTTSTFTVYNGANGTGGTGGTGSASLFVTITGNQSSHTPAEINAAVKNGVTVWLVRNTYIYTCATCTDTAALFSFCFSLNGTKDPTMMCGSLQINQGRSVRDFGVSVRMAVPRTDDTTAGKFLKDSGNGMTWSDLPDGGGTGESGATFTPYVDTSGNLSWSNDKGLANPDTVNIKGDPGSDGVGISSVKQTTTSTADDGNNVITVTLSNGTTSTFKVQNGSKGSQGNPGRGISSVERTSGNGAAGTTDTYTITFTDGTTKTFTVRNGANGTNGVNGATFMPYVDSSGNLSWSNDKGLANPDTVNIKGSKGTDGRGIVSIVRTSGTGAAGSTDIYTITYTDDTTSTFTVYNGANGTGGGGSGEAGENGATFTPYVDAEGNLSWSNDKGLANPDTVNIKGGKGDTGSDGVGISSVKQTTTSTADDGNNVITVTLSNGTTSTFKVQNGSKGSKGDAGYTPVRGTDYWTDSDQAQMVSDVIAALPVYNGEAVSI